MATFAGFESMNGATITRVIDGAHAEWIGCCARRQSDQKFGFFVFKNGANVAISPFCSARGSINQDGTWIAWEGNQHYTGALPGFVALPAGGYAMAPGGSVRVFVDQDGFDDRRIIDLAAAGIPACAALNVRMALDAYAGIIFRCGPEVADPNLQAAAMLTCTGLGVENRAYESGVIGTAGSRALLVATENGAVAKAFVDVLGWWG